MIFLKALKQCFCFRDISNGKIRENDKSSNGNSSLVGDRFFFLILNTQPRLHPESNNDQKFTLFVYTETNLA